MKGRAASTSQLGPFETEVLATEENFAGLTEAAVPRDLFRKILDLIDDPRPRPAPVSAGEIDGQVKTTGGVCLDDGKYGQMAFRTQDNRKIRPSVGGGENCSLDGGAGV